MFDATEHEAEEFLFNNQKHIHARTCDPGWEVIECFGEMDSFTWRTIKMITVETPDRLELIERALIERKGYQVVRYKGHYHQVLGGIRNGYFLSSIQQGRC